MTPFLKRTRMILALCGVCVILVALTCISGCTQTPPVEKMPNPAAAVCVANGGTGELRKTSDGSEYGMCNFANGSSCEEWALYRGEGCKPVTVVTATVPVQGEKKMVTMTEKDNGTTTNISQGSRFAVQLSENPTTGFMWNATVTPGLVIQSSDFSQDPASKGMTGAGGSRTWVILAKDTGIQKFSATYMRSWEPVTGNETTYSANVNVVKL